MIELRNISVERSGRHILKNISAEIHKGDVITIIGPNGAGKSTLLELIAGTIAPTHGTIMIDGNDVTHLSDIERAPLMARLCQNPNMNVVNTMSVCDNLILARLKGQTARLQRVGRSHDTIDTVLRSIMGNGADELLTRQMGNLSGGQRQTVALAMATIKNPKILLLDEPTAALDPKSAANMLASAELLIKEHMITTVLITHDIGLATKVGNKLWVIEDGKITQQLGDEKKALTQVCIMNLLNGIH